MGVFYPLLDGEGQQWPEWTEAVDDRETAASARRAGDRLVSGQEHVLLVPLSPLRFSAACVCLLLQRSSEAKIFGALPLLILSERHD